MHLNGSKVARRIDGSFAGTDGDGAVVVGDLCLTAENGNFRRNGGVASDNAIPSFILPTCKLMVPCVTSARIA
jgi:hypothetical protein